MDVNGVIWVGKKVYVRLISGRCYSGEVVNENAELITILDIKNHLVVLHKLQIEVMQQEDY